jgi:hypothetical protein
MKDFGKVDSSEVVRAFVLAEAHPTSVLVDDWFGPWFASRGLSPAQVQQRLRNTADVEMLALARQAFAEGRGFGLNDRGLFNGFPAEVEWHRVSLSPDEFQTMRYLEFPPWSTLSGGTRLVIEGARAIQSGNIHGEASIAERVNAIAGAMRAGAKVEALVLAQQRDEPLILIDGHHRATAMVLCGQTSDVPGLVGRVASFEGWVFADAWAAGA